MSGVDARRLARIEAFLRERYIDPGKLVGADIAVQRHGRQIYRATAGLADRERGTPIADDTIYRVYSMTKPLTSLAFMMLVEEGKVALDDPVHRFIPSWRKLGVFAAGTRTTGFATTPAQMPMRMVDLLRHTSGLTYGFQNRSNVDAAYRQLKIGEIEKAGDLDSFIAALADLPLEFSPGTAWNYSVSTDVVGYLVGLIAGEPFEDFLKRRILEPVGMVDTGFAVRPSQAHRFAACYTPAAGGGLDLQDDPQTSSFLAPPTFVSGGGGLVSTTADYVRFAEAMLTGTVPGGERLIGRKTLALMTANHLPGGVDLPALSRSLFSEAAYEGVGFGLGFAVTTDPAKTLIPGSKGEYFWGGAASTFFWIDPVEQLTCVFMTQLLPSSTYPVRRELRTLVYSALD
ncbi:MAG: beta-lactamase family protein [Sphingomonadaceae bacterium]|nr:beta-lactamase family protein [Sphingomonadaceae bacterium]